MTDIIRQKTTCRRCGRVFLFVGELYDYVATLIRAGWKSESHQLTWVCGSCHRFEQSERR